MESPPTIGTQFNDLQILKKACQDEAIKFHCEYCILYSENGSNGRYTIKCKNDDCLWRLHVAVVPNTPYYTSER